MPSATGDGDRPDPTFGNVQTGPSAPLDLDATTSEAPPVRIGEWWRYRFRSNLTGIEDVEFVRVVADVTDSGIVYGMPHSGWYKEIISYHAPALGDVALNLSYHTHNLWFQPLKFPLTEGDSWTTLFADAVYDAVVERVDAYTADVAFYLPPSTAPQSSVLNLLLPPSGAPAMRLTYDARVHDIVKMTGGIGDFEVVDHGFDFQGWVTVPRREHTAVDYGTFGPAAPDQPLFTRTFDLGEGYNRMTMLHVVVGLGPGMYRLTSSPPDGDPFVTELVGAPGTAVAIYEASDPQGVWTQEDLVLGAGATYSMGIAYNQYDILVPTGERRGDHSHGVGR